MCKDNSQGLLGYIPYGTLSVQKNKPKLKKELGFRNLEYKEEEGLNILQGILKEAEQSRLKKELASELLPQGFQMMDQRFVHDHHSPQPRLYKKSESGFE
jgi:hypothetical protein